MSAFSKTTNLYIKQFSHVLCNPNSNLTSENELVLLLSDIFPNLNFYFKENNDKRFPIEDLLTLNLKDDDSNEFLFSEEINHEEEAINELLEELLSFELDENINNKFKNLFVTEVDKYSYLYLIFLDQLKIQNKNLKVKELVQFLRYLLYIGKGSGERFLMHFRIAYFIKVLKINTTSKKIKNLIKYLDLSIDFVVYLLFKNSSSKEIFIRETTLLQIKHYFPLNLNISRASINLESQFDKINLDRNVILENLQAQNLKYLLNIKPEITIGNEWLENDFNANIKPALHRINKHFVWNEDLAANFINIIFLNQYNSNFLNHVQKICILVQFLIYLNDKKTLNNGGIIELFKLLDPELQVDVILYSSIKSQIARFTRYLINSETNCIQTILHMIVRLIQEINLSSPIELIKLIVEKSRYLLNSKEEFKRIIFSYTTDYQKYSMSYIINLSKFNNKFLNRNKFISILRLIPNLFDDNKIEYRLLAKRFQHLIDGEQTYENCVVDNRWKSITEQIISTNYYQLITNKDNLLKSQEKTHEQLFIFYSINKKLVHIPLNRDVIYQIYYSCCPKERMERMFKRNVFEHCRYFQSKHTSFNLQRLLISEQRKLELTTIIDYKFEEFRNDLSKLVSTKLYSEATVYIMFKIQPYLDSLGRSCCYNIFRTIMGIDLRGPLSENAFSDWYRQENTRYNKNKQSKLKDEEKKQLDIKFYNLINEQQKVGRPDRDLTRFSEETIHILFNLNTYMSTFGPTKCLQILKACKLSGRTISNEKALKSWYQSKTGRFLNQKTAILSDYKKKELDTLFQTILNQI